MVHPKTISPALVAVLAAIILAPSSGPARAQSFLELFGGRQTKFEEEVVLGDSQERAKILLVPVQGLITMGGSGSPVERANATDRLRWHLEKAVDDPLVRGLLLEVNTPGGEVTAADVMYQQLVRYRQSNKIVVALLGSVAASGGYYIAAAADRVVAHPTTVTGSIGVVMYAPNVVSMFDKIGLKMTVLKSTRTPMKDLLSPTREMTEDERKVMQNLLDRMYDRFVDVVATGRKMKTDQVRRVADGRVYLGPEAKEKGLVDEIGYRADAFALATKLAGVKAAKLVRYKRPPSLMDAVYGLEGSWRGMGEALVDPTALYDWTGPRFLYLAPFGQ